MMCLNFWMRVGMWLKRVGLKSCLTVSFFGALYLLDVWENAFLVSQVTDSCYVDSIHGGEPNVYEDYR